MNSIKNNQNIGKYDRDNIYNIYKTNNDLKDVTIDYNEYKDAIEDIEKFRNIDITKSATGNIKSAPAKHGRDLGHTIAWSSTSIIASCQHRSQLDLLEHAVISTLEPSMNVQHKGPRVNACWHPLLDTIANSFVSKPANLDIGT